MKIILSIFFSIFYLTSTSGIILNAHFCGNKLKHISFSKSDEGNCCGKKKMKKNCCKDKVSYFKVKDTHESSHLLASPLVKYYAFNVSLPVFEFNFVTSNVNVIIKNYHAPPVIYHNPLYLLNKVFLI